MRYNADAVTVNPLLGTDSLVPFLKRSDRGIFVLCNTSNPDATEFQGHGFSLSIARKAISVWSLNENCFLVIGGTYPEKLEKIRQIAPAIPILVPGLGSQSANVHDIMKVGREITGRFIAKP
ncbi:MAG: hypothetical protein EOP48_20865 [Sphingobacteriales bacterium]|nr:MAG: hypothetical protein EOP48_20865 [Sphingobacteriales bacterium]